MAIATFNPSFAPLRGKIGGLVFKHYRDKVVVTRAPVFNKPWTPAQQAARTRFAAASAYARTVQADPVLRCKYARIARQRGLTIRSAAISAYLQGKTDQITTSKHTCRRPPPAKKAEGNAPPLKRPVDSARQIRRIPRHLVFSKQKRHGHALITRRPPDINRTLPPKPRPVLLL